MPDLNRVADILLEWESVWRAGGDVTPEELCRDSPDCLAEVRRRTGLLQKFEEFFSSSDLGQTHPASLIAAPTFPGYSIRGVLGRGGMGVVYRAWQEDLAREVAVKVLKGGTNLQPLVLRRFAQEARLLARLKHDNLVPVYEAKLLLGQPYFVMELVEGGSLAQAVERFVGDTIKAVELVELVALAIQYAHEQGVLHRDLKPANILLDKLGRPRITDFGIAKLFGDNHDEAGDYNSVKEATGNGTLSADGSVLGTPPYMAPEQFQGRSSAITTQTDVWALGVILYELLTGSRPFASCGSLGYRPSVCESTPPSPRSLNPKIDRRLEAIVLKCLNKDAPARYKTASALAHDLERWRRTHGKHAFPSLWVHGVRRLTISAAVLAMVAIVGIVWLVAGDFVNSFSDAERPLKEIEKKLSRGEKVTMIGETGPPSWFRVQTGGNRTQTSLAPDGTFSIHSWDICLLELLRDPQQDQYVLRAQVRHEQSEDQGEIGIYFGHFQYPNQSVSVHTFLYLTFNDVVDASEKLKLLPALKRPVPPPQGNQVNFMSRLFAQSKERVIADDEICGLNPVLFKPAGFRGGPWRTLVVKIGPDKIEGYWEETQVVGQIPIRQLATLADKTLLKRGVRGPLEPSIAQLFPSFPQRGALGLFVRKSSVSFRLVTVEPLTQ